MSKSKIRLKVSKADPDVAYLYLPDFPEGQSTGCVEKQTRLSDLIDGFKGPDLYLDFDRDGTLIGVEILN